MKMLNIIDQHTVVEETTALLFLCISLHFPRMSSSKACLDGARTKNGKQTNLKKICGVGFPTSILVPKKEWRITLMSTLDKGTS
jgi:hypothetical protein